MANLTEKDYEILDFIYKQIKQNGYPPTVREIGAAVNLSSPATVHARLSKLEAAGKIEKRSSKNRTMRVIDYCPEGETEDIPPAREDYLEVLFTVKLPQVYL